MKTLLLLSLICTFTFLDAQQYSSAPFKATDIAVGGSNVWMLGESDEKGEGLFYNKGNTWKFYSGVKGDRIYVGKNNKPIVINNKGVASQLLNNQWKVLNGRVSEIAIAPNNDVIWSIQGGNIYRYSNGQWLPFQGAQIASIKIDIDNSGTLYSINTSGYVFKQVGLNWTLLGTKQAKDITVDESGKVWILSKEWAGDGYKIYSWNGSSWIQFLGGAVHFDAGSKSELWKIDNTGAVHKKTASSWQKKSLNPLNTSANNNSNNNPINYGDNVTQADQYGETSLFKAVRNNDISGIYTLLGKGSNINHLNGKQQNVLFTATQFKFDRVVQLLIKHKINVNQKDTSRNTPLINSINQGDSTTVSILLEAGARPNEDPLVDKVLLYNKTNKKDLGMITNMLMEQGALVNPNHFKTAALQNNTNTYDALCYHADKYLREKEILEIAIKNNNPLIANTCVENGANAAKGLDLGIKTKNTQLITTSISKGADAKKAIDFSIDSKNTSLLDLCLTLDKKNADHAIEYAATKKDSISMDIALKYGGSINKAFVKIIETNDMKLIQYGLNRNADPAIGLLPAVKKNNFPLVQLLFNKGAQVNSPELMATAVGFQNREMVLLLLSKGASANDGMLAAVTKNNIEFVTLLFENGANGGAQFVVETASKFSSKEILEMVLNKGGVAQLGLLAAIEANNKINVKTLFQFGANAMDSKYIQAAIKKGNLDIVKELINYNADPNDGIKLAVSKGKNDILVFLISKGGSVSDGALFLDPINSNNTAIAKTLIDNGCNTGYTDIKKNNLLHIAGLKQKTDIARLFLATKKININAKNDVGNSPLHLVVSNGKNLELCQIYVESGADINAKNSMGKVVYKVARGGKVKKYLKSKGAKKK